MPPRRPQAHKNSEAAKAATRDAANLKQKIRMLEEEREKLGDKVERARNQVRGATDGSMQCNRARQLPRHPV